MWPAIAIAVGATLAVYAAFVLALAVAGHRTEAAALARFIPTASSSYDDSSPIRACRRGGSWC